MGQLSFTLNKLINSSLGAVGLELRKCKSHHVDYFGDQVRLLAGAPVEVIFDLGASEGLTAQTYRSLFPDATIYSFEPTDSCFQILSDRFRGDNKVVPVHAAVGREDGTATLFLNSFDQTNSLLPAAPGSEKLVGASLSNVGTQPVPVISLESFCRERGIDKVDLLKMDIQGFEINALRGFKETLARQTVRVIYTEVLFGNSYDGQGYYHDIASFLQPLGYELYGLYTLMRGVNGMLAQAEAIFINQEVRKRLS